MSDQDKSREELLAELAALRRVVDSYKTGRKLRESEETVRALLNAPVDLAFLLELDGTIVTLNELAARSLNLSVEELTGRNIYDLITPELGRARRPLLDRVVSTGKPVRNIDQRGGRWYNYRVVPVMDASGAKVNLLAIYSRDITEERATEAALRASETTARALLNAPYDTALLVEPDGTIVTANQWAARSFGTTVEELRGQNVFRYFSADVGEQRKPFGQEVQRTGKPVRQVDQRGGRWYDYTIYPIHDDAGEQVVRFAIFARDITEQKKMESALRDSEEKYRNLVEQSQQGIVVIGDGRFQYVNSSFANILGYTIPELMAMVETEIRATIHHDDQEVTFTRINALLSGEREPSTNEFRVVRKDGAIRWVRLSSSVIDLAGRRAVQGIILDIDDSKKLEQRIFQAHKMEAVGRLAGGVAHDFNNLLTAILGYGKSLVRKMDPEDPLHENAREISMAAERAARLTRQLLTFSRKQAMKPELFNVNSIVHGMWNMLSSLISSNIQVILRLTPGLGTIKADPGQLEQVLMNLVLNARDAMKDGGTLTIETTPVDLGADELRDNPDALPGQFVCLAVRDTGIGLEKKQLRHIFEPFFSTKGLVEGTGLGLSMVYGIVQQHGGVITVESEPGLGSSFCIYLPLSRDESSPVTEEPRPVEQAAREEKRVLVVEDEHVVRRFIASILREFGYEVAEAESAEEAEMNFGHQSESFDLLLADIMLPGRSGIHLVKDLIADNPKLAVVLTSGYAVKESELNFVRVSNFQYLEKPFTDEELMASVRRALETASLNDPSAEC